MEVKQKTEGQRSEQALEVNMEGRFDEQEIRLKQVDRTREIMQHTAYQFDEDNMKTSAENKVNTGMQSDS